MKNRKRNKRFETILALVMMVIVLFVVFAFSDDKELQKEVVEKVTDTVTDIATYEMSEEEIKELPSTEIKEQTEEQEKEVSAEQEVEKESFELQGEVAYEGDTQYGDITLGDYIGLTYYSQIDSRWSSHPYTSIGDYSQTIGTSGCGPTCRSNDCNSNSWQYYSRKNAEMIGFLTDIGLLTKAVIGQLLDI